MTYRELLELEPRCNPHPKAPHGFLRNASHNEHRYVCECEGWEPYEAGYQAGMEAALAESAQEPVAWMDREGDIYKMPEIEGWAPPHTMLYTSPPLRKPLTDDEIAMIVADCSASAHRHDDFNFARAIERAVWEKNNG